MRSECRFIHRPCGRCFHLARRWSSPAGAGVRDATQLSTGRSAPVHSARQAASSRRADCTNSIKTLALKTINLVELIPERLQRTLFEMWEGAAVNPAKRPAVRFNHEQGAGESLTLQQLVEQPRHRVSGFAKILHRGKGAIEKVFGRLTTRS